MIFQAFHLFPLKHYMTQGIADFTRRFYYSSFGSYAKVNYASRVVFEATYDGMTTDLHNLVLPLIATSGVETNLRLTDVKLISGNEEDLKQNRLYIDKKGLYVGLFAVIPEKADNQLRRRNLSSPSPSPSRTVPTLPCTWAA